MEKGGFVFSYNPLNVAWQDYRFSKFLYKDTASVVQIMTHIMNESDQVVLKMTNRKHNYTDMHEMNMLRKIIHPNVVQLYGVELSDSLVMLYIEYIPGESLLSMVIQRGPLPLEEIMIYYYEMLNLLIYLEKIEIVHLDIKPEHILVHRESQVVKLIDFDSAQNLSKPNLTIDGPIGSPPYMAPEMYSQKGCPTNYNKCDIFSLHVVLACCLTGDFCWNAPCDSDIRFRCWHLYSNPCHGFANLDTGIFQFFKRVLVVNPELRPSASQVKKDIFIEEFIHK